MLNDGLLVREEFERRKNALLDSEFAPGSASGGCEQSTDIGLQSGQELGSHNKRYRLQRVLGQGGMGQVWQAIDLATHAELGHSEMVALKILPPELSHSARHVRLLIEEATQARRLAHEHIVRVYDWAQDPVTASHFMVMEYLDGQDLKSYLRESGPFTLARVLELLTPVAHALRYAWEKHRLVHCDLKPGNLFLTRHGDIKLLDFGIAARLHEVCSELGMASSANGGTAGYRAPEAVLQQTRPCPRLDVHALAVTIYQLLEGKMPFAKGANREHQPSPPSVLDLAQWRVLQSGFACEAALRPATVPDLLEALQNAAAASQRERERQQLVPERVAEQAKVEQQRKRIELEEQRRLRDEAALRQRAEQSRKRRELDERRRRQASLALRDLVQQQRMRDAHEEDERRQVEADVRMLVEQHRMRQQLEDQEKRQIAIAAALRARRERRNQLESGSVFKDRFLDGSAEGPELVVLPTGRFLMGSSESERLKAIESGAQKVWLERETPQHWVGIAHSFAIGKYPVTVGQWRQYVKATGWRSSDKANWESPGFAQTNEHPVVCISWDDVQTYLAWLSTATGQIYRLPSEAEWEYACRASSKTAFSFGDTIDTGRANYDGNFTFNGGPKGEFRSGTTSVNSFKPNKWGLFDMHGNVWEWTQDAVHDNYLGAPVDGSAWEGDGDRTRRIVRGGSWLYTPRYLRSALRNGFSAWGKNDIVGFRLATTLRTLADEVALQERLPPRCA